MAKRTYNRRGRVKAKTPVTSSARRPTRVKGAETARRTGSPDKMTRGGQGSGTGTARVTRGRGLTTRQGSSTPRGAAGPRSAPAQGPMRRVSGVIGDRPKVKNNTPPKPNRTPSPRPKATSAAVRKLGIGAGAATVGKALALLGITEGLAPQKAADGTLDAARKRGDYKPKQGPANPEKGMTRAQSFDKAFAAARKAGKKEFTWRGKRYNTNRK
tara:strand:- start:197 stop:838 length:642 start_codon:yes stop_codon:yes gene_type:complete